MEATQSEQARWIRTLRFPGELETNFRQEHFMRSVKVVRLTTALTVIMLLMLFAIDVVRRPMVAQPVIGFLVPAIAAASAFCLSYHPSFVRWWQPFLTCIGIVAGVTLLMGTATGVLRIHTNWDDVAKIFSLACNLIILQVVATITLRLSSKWTAVMNAILVCEAFLISKYVLKTPALLSIEYLSRSSGIVTTFLIIGAYTLERYARADFLLKRQLETERHRADRLLLNVMPQQIAQRLKSRPEALSDSYDSATILFADIVGFTTLAAGMDAAHVVALLNRVFSVFDTICEQNGLEKIKTFGDAYMAAGGVPEPMENHASAACRAALEMQAALSRLVAQTGAPLQLRIGVHTGPVEAGVIGSTRLTYDLWGDTVNIASRLQESCEAGGVLISDQTAELLGGQFELSEPETIQAKGIGAVAARHLLCHETARSQDKVEILR